MNQRAFNLFTALVSFVLIMLTVLMVNTMTRTEDRAISTVMDLQQQSEMQTIADLTRGDAFQILVFRIRQSVEEYFVNTPADELTNVNYITIQKAYSWDDILDDFACGRFGVCPSAGTGETSEIAEFMANGLGGLLYEGKQMGRYKVSTEGLNEAANFRQAVIDSLKAQDADPSNDFEEVFELSNCSYVEDEVNPSNSYADCDDGGTFYIKMRFDTIDPQIYEKLPKIVVEDYNVTGAVLKTSIIPRASLRVFVPLRVFQALARAKEIADKTVFTTQVENKVKNLELGLCEENKCRIVTDPAFPANGKYPTEIDSSKAACPGVDPTDLYSLQSKVLDSVNIPGTVLLFNPSDASNVRDKLEEYAILQLCAYADSAVPDETLADAYSGELELERRLGSNCIFSKASFSPGLKQREMKVAWAAGSPLSSGKGYCATYKYSSTPPMLKMHFREKNQTYKVENAKDGYYEIRIIPDLAGGTAPNLAECRVDCSNTDIGSICSNPTCGP